MPFLLAAAVPAALEAGGLAAAGAAAWSGVAGVTALGVVLSGAFAATGAIVECKVDHKCTKKKRDDIPIARIGLAKRQVPRMTRRQDVGACGVPQYNFDMCHEDLKGVVVQTSIPAEGVAKFDNVPASCLDLATALTGGCGIDPPYPVICGSSCMQYTGLSTEQMDQLSNALNGFAAE